MTWSDFFHFFPPKRLSTKIPDSLKGDTRINGERKRERQRDRMRENEREREKCKSKMKETQRWSMIREKKKSIKKKIRRYDECREISDAND